MSNYFDKYKRTFNYDICRMMPMKESPFAFRDDENFRNLVESIRQYGLLEPIIVIPHLKESGKYEIVSGVRRWYACRTLDYTNISCIVADKMSRDEAIIFMVDSNLCNRESILPSEKAFAYKMKMDAMKRQGKRTDLTSDQVGPKLTAEEISDSDSVTQVKRYIRLTNLIPDLLDLMDKGRIAFMVGVELSYLPEEAQKAVYDYYVENEVTPSYSQANQMKKLCAEGTLTPEKMTRILEQPKPNQVEMFRIPAERIRPFFDQKASMERMQEVIVKALEYYAKYLERQRKNRDAR